MKPLAFILLLTFTASAAATGNIPPRVESFIKKVEIYYDKHQVNWIMPNSKPSPSDEMPSPIIVGMMTMDPETGLAFSPSNGNLYDPELEVGLEASSGTVVDFNTGKKYALKEILEERKKRNEL